MIFGMVETVTMKRSCRFLALVLVGAAYSGAQADEVRVSQRGNVVTLRNSLLRVDYDLAKGSYEVADLKPGGLRLVGAHSRWNRVDSASPGIVRNWRSTPASTPGGRGRTLIVTCKPGTGPDYSLKLTLLENSGRLLLGSVVATPTALRISSFEPWTGIREPFRPKSKTAPTERVPTTCC
jgi:hypothetical protein